MTKGGTSSLHDTLPVVLKGTWEFCLTLLLITCQDECMSQKEEPSNAPDQHCDSAVVVVRCVPMSDHLMCT